MAVLQIGVRWLLSYPPVGWMLNWTPDGPPCHQQPRGAQSSDAVGTVLPSVGHLALLVTVLPTAAAAVTQHSYALAAVSE